MALHDTDKNSINRLKPTLNTKDVNNNRQAHGTIGFTLKQEDTDTSLGKLVFKDGNLKLVKTTGNTVDITGDGIKIAQPGFDATTTSDSNLVLTSGLNSFKIIASGEITVVKAANSSFATSSVPHGQTGTAGQIVTSFVDPQDSGIDRIQTPSISILSSGLVYGIWSVQTDPTDIIFKVSTPNITGGLYAVAFTARFKYYILVETAGQVLL